jgi:hypothetical protein
VAPSGHSPLSTEDCNLPRPSVAQAFSVCFPFGAFFQTNFQEAEAQASGDGNEVAAFPEGLDERQR